MALNWRGRPPADPPPYWATALDANGIVGCACRTPPHQLVLSRVPAAAVAPLIEDVGRVYRSLNGVGGPTADAEAFARAWVARSGGTWITTTARR